MKAIIKNGNLLIKVPLQEPRCSSTGKTMIIASTHGVKRTTAQFREMEVSITLNAFIYPDAESGEIAEQKRKEVRERLLTRRSRRRKRIPDYSGYQKLLDAKALGLIQDPDE